jgi:hypothetical protein
MGVLAIGCRSTTFALDSWHIDDREAVAPHHRYAIIVPICKFDRTDASMQLGLTLMLAVFFQTEERCSTGAQWQAIFPGSRFLLADQLLAIGSPVNQRIASLPGQMGQLARD